MPWLGDEIEARLRLGKVPLFKKGVDDSEEELSRRQTSRIGSDAEDDGIQPTDEGQPSTDDDGETFTDEEQIEEALNIILFNVQDRISLVEDSVECMHEYFNLNNVRLTVLNDENMELALLSDDSYAALHDLRNNIDGLRLWLVEQISPNRT